MKYYLCCGSGYWQNMVSILCNEYIFQECLPSSNRTQPGALKVSLASSRMFVSSIVQKVLLILRDLWNLTRFRRRCWAETCVDIYMDDLASCKRESRIFLEHIWSSVSTIVVPSYCRFLYPRSCVALDHWQRIGPTEKPIV
jgi:hypothetical protein